MNAVQEGRKSFEIAATSEIQEMIRKVAIMIEGCRAPILNILVIVDYISERTECLSVICIYSFAIRILVTWGSDECYCDSEGSGRVQSLKPRRCGYSYRPTKFPMYCIIRQAITLVAETGFRKPRPKSNSV